MVLLALGPAHSAEPAPPRGIEVTGEGKVDVRADLALIDVAVVAEAATAAAAARENAQRMERVVAALRRLVAADGSVQTGTYSIRPQYSASRDQRSPRITGFVVSNAVHVRTKAVDRVGELIDAAVQAGGNRIERLEFTLADATAPRREALRRAALDARDEAEVLARALGVRLGSVRAVTEQDLGAVRPLARQAVMMHAESAPATPVEPGEVEVRARVTLVLEIAEDKEQR
jgi:uncharacterized protein YggE